MLGMRFLVGHRALVTCAAEDAFGASVARARGAGDQARGGATPTVTPPQQPGSPPAAGGAIGLFFVPSARRKTRKNRLHLDLSGASGQAREVARSLGLGATRADIGQGDVPWDVLADPEGNEFRVAAGGQGAAVRAAPSRSAGRCSTASTIRS